MDNKNLSWVGTLLKLIAGLIGLTIAALLASWILNAVGHYQTSVIILVLTAAFWAVVFVVGAFVVGSAYTRTVMRDGAAIALHAQDSNDRWDERKTAALGRLFQAGALAGRNAVLPEPTALPDTTSWLPRLSAPNRQTVDSMGTILDEPD